jgi:PRTRC genetic system protein C
MSTATTGGFAILHQRVFLKRGTETIPLPTPTPNASIEAIRAFNLHEYPELGTCGVDPTSDDNGPIITFKTNVGNRG